MRGDLSNWLLMRSADSGCRPSLERPCRKQCHTKWSYIPRLEGHVGLWFSGRYCILQSFPCTGVASILPESFSSFSSAGRQLHWRLFLYLPSGLLDQRFGYSPGYQSTVSVATQRCLYKVGWRALAESPLSSYSVHQVFQTLATGKASANSMISSQFFLFLMGKCTHVSVDRRIQTIQDGSLRPGIR